MAIKPKEERISYGPGLRAVDPVQPIPIRNGLIHLHWTTGKGRCLWKVVLRQNKLCGTPRCVRMEVNTSSFKVPCEHIWAPPPWGTVKCERCGEVKEVEIDLSDVV